MRSPAEALFASNLSLIDKVIDRVCREAGLRGADAEDFASNVKVALIEDDYAVLRAWQQRSSLATYLTVIVHRLLVDERNRAFGRWEPSAEARRLGKAAVVLETLVRRDGRPLDEIMPLVRDADASLTRADCEAMLARIPERPARPRPLPLDDVHEAAMRSPEEADAAALAAELGQLSEQTCRVVRDTLAALPLQSRMTMRLRFGMELSIADVSRMMNVPQRPLYRTVEAVLAQLRRALLAAGINGRAAAEVIGAQAKVLDFGLSNGKSEVVSQSDQHEDGP
jgi:RNA polymerase sigma factor for flagellar operon FliA